MLGLDRRHSKPFDEKSFLQRYTPRGKKSIWSTRNVDIVERLTEEGRMQPAGQARSISPRPMAAGQGLWRRQADEFPPDLLAAIEAEPASAGPVRSASTRKTAMRWPFAPTI